MRLVLTAAAVSAVSGEAHVTRAKRRNQKVQFDAFTTYCTWSRGRLSGPSRLLGAAWPVTRCTRRKDERCFQCSLCFLPLFCHMGNPCWWRGLPQGLALPWISELEFLNATKRSAQPGSNTSGRSCLGFLDGANMETRKHSMRPIHIGLSRIPFSTSGFPAACPGEEHACNVDLEECISGAHNVPVGGCSGLLENGGPGLFSGSATPTWAV